jgi:hypothetical protein
MPQPRQNHRGRSLKVIYASHACAGAQQFIVNPLFNDLDHLEIFVREILPHL